MKKVWLIAGGAVGFLLFAGGIFKRLSRKAPRTWDMEERSRHLAERREHRIEKRAARHRDEVGLLDLNLATRKELQALGIDHTMAQQIIDNRPFATKMDLVGRRVVPVAVYERIRTRVAVHPITAA